LFVNDLVEYPEEEDLQRVNDIALNEPLLLHRLLSPKAHVTAVNATVQLPQLTEAEIPETVKYARVMIEQYRLDHPEVEVYITGSVMLGNAFSESAQKDLTSLFLVMLLIIFVTLLLLLRSFTGTISTMIIIILSIASAMSMILGIVVDDTVHLLSKYRRVIKDKGYSSKEAVQYAFKTGGTALWVTTFVLVSGFLVLALSDLNMNAYMGIFTACTITLALIFDFIALPALLLKTDSKKTVSR
jgi:predicted RND superfamily exporter protein